MKEFYFNVAVIDYKDVDRPVVKLSYLQKINEVPTRKDAINNMRFVWIDTKKGGLTETYDEKIDDDWTLLFYHYIDNSTERLEIHEVTEAYYWENKKP